MRDCCDPTSDSPDPVVVRLEAEVERLNGDYAKLYGVVREYIVCEKHPQIRGEAYRDLRSTYDLLSGADADQGWPACYERKCREVAELSRKAGELEAANEELRAEVERLNTAWKAIDRANESLREQLQQQTKSFCTHCGKLFPKGKEGVEQFREHIAECNKHPLHKMAVDNSTLRGLLRDIVAERRGETHAGLIRIVISPELFEKAALEGKP